MLFQYPLFSWVSILLTYVFSSVYSGMELKYYSSSVHLCHSRHLHICYPSRNSPYKVDGNPLTEVPLEKVEAPKPLNNQEDLWKLVHEIDIVCMNKSYYDSFSCYDTHYTHFFNYQKISYRNDRSLFRNLINNDPVVISEHCESNWYCDLLLRFWTVFGSSLWSSNQELHRQKQVFPLSKVFSFSIHSFLIYVFFMEKNALLS